MSTTNKKGKINRGNTQKSSSNGRRNPRNVKSRKDMRSTDARSYDNTPSKDDISGRGPASNDVRWYASNAELLRSAASIPFSTTTGLPLPWNEQGNFRTIPGVMTLEWAPTIGGGFIDPINQAANSTYSYVVHANSRNKSYDAPDLMIMILCGASLFSMLAMGIRAYGVMRTFAQQNAYLPEALIKSMGFNYSDLKNNLSRMWFDINELIARSSQIWIPNDFPFIERWFWLNTNIYIDAASVKGQYYIFVPSSYLVFNETGDFAEDNHVAEAKYSYWTSGSETAEHTWEEYMEVMNDMFTPLLASQDRGMIFGDILKAYGPDHLYALPPITSDYMVQPVYDPEVLTQIENASVCGGKTGLWWESISQDPDTNLIYTSATTPMADREVRYPNPTMWTPPLERQVLNFHTTTDPTPEMIMVATRLKCAGVTSIPNGKGSATLSGNKVGGFAPLACGTEVLVMVRIWRMNTTKGTAEGYVLETVVPDNKSWATGSLGEYVAFDWAPWIYSCDWNKPWIEDASNAITKADLINAGQPRPIHQIGDFDFYTTIGVDELQKMHRTAIYSEFGVPTIG
nr:putative capsid [Marmot picobirnavirus]